MILRMRWLEPSFSYSAADTAWTWVRRRMIADRPSDRTISRAMARRPVSRPAVAARPASVLARRAAMRRLGLGHCPSMGRAVVRNAGPGRGATRRRYGRVPRWGFTSAQPPARLGAAGSSGLALGGAGAMR